MRKIEFREWDPVREEMYHGDIPGLAYGVRYDNDDCVIFGFPHQESDEKRILEQFTCVYDKNGQEIYENNSLAVQVNKNLQNFAVWYDNHA